MLPLSTTESPRFRKILDKIPATRKPTSDRKTFSHYLNKCYTDMESKLKIIFESSLDHVSANKKSYLGMMVHWIDSITLKLEKAALACKRVRGRHTYNVIACVIDLVHSPKSCSVITTEAEISSIGSYSQGSGCSRGRDG